MVSFPDNLGKQASER